MRIWMVFFLILLTSCTSLQAPEKPPKPVQYLYNNITVEIQQTAAISVIVSELDTLKDSLHEYRICRRSNINVIVKDPILELVHAWSRSMVVAFAGKHRTLYDRRLNDRHLIVYISLLPGVYLERGGNVIGLAFADQHIALFNNFSSYVLLHEFGHSIGLVDREHREDEPINPDRPRHCNVKRCVMFWQANRRGRFDDRCLKDLDRMIAERHH